MKVLASDNSDTSINFGRRAQVESFLIAGAEALVLLGQSFEKTYEKQMDLAATQIAAGLIKAMAYSAVPASIVGVAHFGVDPLAASIFTTLGLMKTSSLKQDVIKAKESLRSAQANHIPYSTTDLVHVCGALKTSLSALGLSAFSHRVDLVKDDLIKEGKMRHQSPKDLLVKGLGINSDFFQAATPPDRSNWNRQEAVADIKDLIDLLKASQVRKAPSTPSF